MNLSFGIRGIARFAVPLVSFITAEITIRIVIRKDEVELMLLMGFIMIAVGLYIIVEHFTDDNK